MAKFAREKQPVNACRECLRILGGDKRLIQRYPLAESKERGVLS